MEPLPRSNAQTQFVAPILFLVTRGSEYTDGAAWQPVCCWFICGACERRSLGWNVRTGLCYPGKCMNARRKSQLRRKIGAGVQAAVGCAIADCGFGKPKRGGSARN